MDNADAESVQLILGQAKTKAEKELTQYFITDDPKSPTIKLNGNNGIEMEIVFKRRLTNEAMMTFFPSLLLIAISYATSFFKLPNFFNTAITVNLTVMLTITTLLISVVKKLAQTSYIKWMEAWLIFAMLIPFTQVILITGMEWSKEMEMKEEKRDEEKEPEMVRSKEHIWLRVGGQTVKVNIARTETYKKDFILYQVLPLEPNPQKSPDIDIAGAISVIGGMTMQYAMQCGNTTRLIICLERKAVPVVVLVALCIYWVFGFMFYYGLTAM